jgi:general secretion pathway protein K
MTSRGFILRFRRRGRPRPRQKGIALIAAIVALGICAVVSYDFSGTTNLDYAAAANHRDAVRAQFLARSALNLSELVIRMQQELDAQRNNIGPMQITDYADQLMMAFCGTREEVEGAVGVPMEQLKGLGADVGTCGVSYFETEDGKINLNCAGGNAATAEALKKRLQSLVFFPAFDPIFQEETADGWRRDRDTQVYALLDYVDKDRAKTDAPGTPEDFGYENLRDDYKAKDNYLDSPGEIRLIRGVDDRFWNVFGPAFTIYGSCKTNLSAVKDTNLIASIIQLTAKEPNDPVVQDPQKLWLLAGVVVKAREFGFVFGSTADFVEFVKDPRAAMGAATQDPSQPGGAAGGATGGSTGGIDPLQACCGIPAGTPIGVALEQTKVDQIATAEAYRTYRVEAWGEVARAQLDAEGNPIFPPIRRTWTGVWNTKNQNQNKRNNVGATGTWVFLKEE